MTVSLDLRAIKANARSLLRSGRARVLKLSALYLAIDLVLNLVDAAVSYMIYSSGGFTVFSFSFVSILVRLISIVLSAGFVRCCLGILRGEYMPYESLFDAFPFAGKVILLSIVEGLFIFLWSMLFVIPGIIAAYRYSFAMMNLCDDPGIGVMEALRRSKQQTDGNKGTLFLLDELSRLAAARGRGRRACGLSHLRRHQLAARNGRHAFTGAFDHARRSGHRKPRFGVDHALYPALALRVLSHRHLERRRAA